MRESLGWPGGPEPIGRELCSGERVVHVEMAVNDAELMARVQNGDREAFAVLVDKYKHRLVNYLTNLLRDRDRAEELAQESFLRLFVHASRYEERGQFLPYLFCIATNLVRTDERTRRRRIFLANVFLRPQAAASENPQADLLRREATERVRQAIAELPLPFRSPLVLYEVEGWSYGDIATALGCREGTVKSRISRARSQLRTKLESYWNGAVACPEYLK